MNECVCGHKEFESVEIHELSMARCLDCGVLRQVVDLTPEEISQYYRDTYHQEEYTHTLLHDTKIARMRIKQYGLHAGQRVLDLGSGNGALVMACRCRNIEAYGVELSSTSSSPHVFQQDLMDVHFPTEYFDVVMLNDVLEHFPDPRPYLEEIFRILKPNGKMVVDFPNYEREIGRAHV